MMTSNVSVALPNTLSSASDARTNLALPTLSMPRSTTAPSTTPRNVMSTSHNSGITALANPVYQSTTGPHISGSSTSRRRSSTLSTSTSSNLLTNTTVNPLASLFAAGGPIRIPACVMAAPAAVRLPSSSGPPPRWQSTGAGGAEGGAASGRGPSDALMEMGESRRSNTNLSSNSVSDGGVADDPGGTVVTTRQWNNLSSMVQSISPLVSTSMVFQRAARRVLGSQNVNRLGANRRQSTLSSSNSLESGTLERDDLQGLIAAMEEEEEGLDTLAGAGTSGGRRNNTSGLENGADKRSNSNTDGGNTSTTPERAVTNDKSDASAAAGTGSSGNDAVTQADTTEKDNSVNKVADGKDEAGALLNSLISNLTGSSASTKNNNDASTSGLNTGSAGTTNGGAVTINIEENCEGNLAGVVKTDAAKSGKSTNDGENDTPVPKTSGTLDATGGSSGIGDGGGGGGDAGDTVNAPAAANDAEGNEETNEDDEEENDSNTPDDPYWTGFMWQLSVLILVLLAKFLLHYYLVIIEVTVIVMVFQMFNTGVKRNVVSNRAITIGYKQCFVKIFEGIKKKYNCCKRGRSGPTGTVNTEGGQPTDDIANDGAASTGRTNEGTENSASAIVGGTSDATSNGGGASNAEGAVSNLSEAAKSELTTASKNDADGNGTNNSSTDTAEQIKCKDISGESKACANSVETTSIDQTAGGTVSDATRDVEQGVKFIDIRGGNSDIKAHSTEVGVHYSKCNDAAQENKSDTIQPNENSSKDTQMVFGPAGQTSTSNSSSKNSQQRKDSGCVIINITTDVVASNDTSNGSAGFPNGVVSGSDIHPVSCAAKQPSQSVDSTVVTNGLLKSNSQITDLSNSISPIFEPSSDSARNLNLNATESKCNSESIESKNTDSTVTSSDATLKNGDPSNITSVTGSESTANAESSSSPNTATSNADLPNTGTAAISSTGETDASSGGVSAAAAAIPAAVSTISIPDLSEEDQQAQESVQCLEDRVYLVLFTFLIAPAFVYFFYFVIWKDEALYRSLGFLPPQVPPLFLTHILWMCLMLDYFARLCTVWVKACLCMLLMCSSSTTLLNKGKYYPLLEMISQLYRSLIPIHPWFIYIYASYDYHYQTTATPMSAQQIYTYPLTSSTVVSNITTTSTEGPALLQPSTVLLGQQMQESSSNTGDQLFGLAIFMCYLLNKKIDLVTRFCNLWQAIKALRANTGSYGTVPSKSELDNSGGKCPICHDQFKAPTLLQCSHIFCEGCIVQWFQRERICPMCRAQIADDPMWKDGATGQLPQII